MSLAPRVQAYLILSKSGALFSQYFDHLQTWTVQQQQLFVTELMTIPRNKTGVISVRGYVASVMSNSHLRFVCVGLPGENELWLREVSQEIYDAMCRTLPELPKTAVLLEAYIDVVMRVVDELLYDGFFCPVSNPDELTARIRLERSSDEVPLEEMTLRSAFSMIRKMARGVSQ